MTDSMLPRSRRRLSTRPHPRQSLPAHPRPRRSQRSRLLGPILALVISLPLAGSLSDCRESSVLGCPEGHVGSYEMVFDFESLSQVFACNGIETVIADVSDTGSGLEVTYLDMGPFPITVDDDALTWTEASTRNGLTTSAEYSIQVTDCVVQGQGTFSREFGGVPCAGVVSISGIKATP